jgi:hypothetical protein
MLLFKPASGARRASAVGADKLDSLGIRCAQAGVSGECQWVRLRVTSSTSAKGLKLETLEIMARARRKMKVEYSAKQHRAWA